MRPGAPVLHDYAPDNVTKHIPIRVGDVEKGFAESDLVVEETYSTQPIEHAYLEPEAGLAYVDHDGVVTIVSPDQNITHHRHMLARIIAKPISKVRFIMSPVGGGFGGKEDMIYQGMLASARDEDAAAGAARVHARRIDYLHRQAPPFAHGAAHGTDARWPYPRAAMNMICDGGAYGLSTEGVMRKAAILAAGPYAIPNVKGRHLRHLHQQHAIRRVSAPSARCRRRLRQNLISIFAPSGSGSIHSKSGGSMRCATAHVTHTKAKLGSVSLMRALDALEKASGWEAGAPTSRGRDRAAISTVPISGPPCALGARFAGSREAGSGGVGAWPASADEEWQPAGTASRAPR